MSGERAVVVGERSLQLGDGGCDRRGHIPGVARQRQIDAAHREFELDEALAVDRFAGDDRDAEFLLEAARRERCSPALAARSIMFSTRITGRPRSRIW